jgi:hypothetical protein
MNNKERQVLYDWVKSLSKLPYGSEFEWKGKKYKISDNSDGSYPDNVFVWFNHRILFCYFNCDRNYFQVGDQIFKIYSKKEKKAILLYCQEI